MSDNKLLNVTNKTNFSQFKLNSHCTSSCHVAKQSTCKSLNCARSCAVSNCARSFKKTARAGCRLGQGLYKYRSCEPFAPL